MTSEAERERPRDARVADVMTSPVFTLSATQSLPLAESMMGLRKVRHIPVVDAEGRVVGLVTHRDLLRAKISELVPLSADERSTLQLAIPVSRIMRDTVWTIRSTALAETAARIMREHRYGCLPVVDDGRLVGIVTEADLLALLSRPPRVVDVPTIERAMTPAPTTIAPTTSIVDARALMRRFGVHHLPVVDAAGAPLTTVTDRDLRIAETIFAASDRTSAAHVTHLIGESRVPHVAPGAHLPTVLEGMVRDAVDAVLVVEDGRLAGILTATDACRLLAAHLGRTG